MVFLLPPCSVSTMSHVIIFVWFSAHTHRDTHTQATVSTQTKYPWITGEERRGDERSAVGHVMSFVSLMRCHEIMRPGNPRNHKICISRTMQLFFSVEKKMGHRLRFQTQLRKEGVFSFGECWCSTLSLLLPAYVHLFQSKRFGAVCCSPKDIVYTIFRTHCSLEMKCLQHLSQPLRNDGRFPSLQHLFFCAHFILLRLQQKSDVIVSLWRNGR